MRVWWCWLKKPSLSHTIFDRFHSTRKNPSFSNSAFWRKVIFFKTPRICHICSMPGLKEFAQTNTPSASFVWRNTKMGWVDALCVRWRVFLAILAPPQIHNKHLCMCASSLTTHSVSRARARANTHRNYTTWCINRLGKREKAPKNIHTFCALVPWQVVKVLSLSSILWLFNSLKNFRVCIFRSVQANGAGHPGDFRAVGPGARRPHPVHLRGARHPAPRDQGRLWAQLQGVLHQPAPQPGANEPGAYHKHQQTEKQFNVLHKFTIVWRNSCSSVFQLSSPQIYQNLQIINIFILSYNPIFFLFLIVEFLDSL